MRKSVTKNPKLFVRMNAFSCLAVEPEGLTVQLQTLEEIIFSVLVRIIGSTNNVEWRPANQHFEHQDS